MKKKYTVKLKTEEQNQLRSLTKSGTLSVRALKCAQILLKVNESVEGSGWSDGAIAEALEVHPLTVSGVRKRYVERGLGSVLQGRYTGHNHRVMTGDVEAHLIALVCGEPLTGQASWTMQLLADKLVALEIVERISDETVRQTLKKMSLSRGSKKNGVSRRKPTRPS